MNTKFYSFIDTQTEHDILGNYPNAKRIEVEYLSTLYALLQQYALTKLCKDDDPDVFDAVPWEDENALNDPRTCLLYRFRNRNPIRRSTRKRQQQSIEEENTTKRSKTDTIDVADDQSEEPPANNNKRKHTSDEHTSDDHTSGNMRSRQSKQQKTQDSEDVDGSVDVDDDNNMDTCLLCSDGGGE